MARIPMVEYETASPQAKKEYDDQIAKHGRITNMKKTLLNNIPSFKALMEWYTLRDELALFLDDFSINIFSYAISSENSCLICSNFFKKILVDGGKDPNGSDLSEKEALLCEFGRACVDYPNEISNEMFSELKKFFTDEQIVTLTAFAGLMIATNLINNVLKVDLDGYLENYAKM